MDARGETQQGLERCHRGAPPVEAEGELVQVGRLRQEPTVADEVPARQGRPALGARAVAHALARLPVVRERVEVERHAVRAGGHGAEVAGPGGLERKRHVLGERGKRDQREPGSQCGDEIPHAVKLGVFARALLTFYWLRVRRRRIADGRPGTVTMIRRFAGGPNPRLSSVSLSTNAD